MVCGLWKSFFFFFPVLLSPSHNVYSAWYRNISTYWTDSTLSILTTNKSENLIRKKWTVSLISLNLLHSDVCMCIHLQYFENNTESFHWFQPFSNDKAMLHWSKGFKFTKDYGTQSSKGFLKRKRKWNEKNSAICTAKMFQEHIWKLCSFSTISDFFSRIT